MKELLDVYTNDGIVWISFGFFAQTLFFLRFMVQWIVSEVKQESIIPVSFWYLSIVGSIGLLVYAIHIKDPVFIVGNSIGFMVYIRNLTLIYKKKKTKIG